MMRKFIVAAIALTTLSACTDGPSAQRVLERNGFTEIKMSGYSFFACSKEDTYHTGFEAKAPNGERITGTVCSGWLFKNSRITFD